MKFVLPERSNVVYNGPNTINKKFGRSDVSLNRKVTTEGDRKVILTEGDSRFIKGDIIDLYKFVELYKESFRTLPEFVTLASPFFTDEIEYEDAPVQKHLKKGNPSLIKDAYKKLKEVKDFSSITELEDCLRLITTEHSVGFGKLAQPIRVAIIGKSASAGIFETLELLGKEKTLKRLEHTINTFL